MDISSNSTAEHCCICLESNDIVSCCFKDKIRHIPCKCNMYCHKYCFEQTNTTHCMICKQEYTFSWGENPNKPKKKKCCDGCYKKTKKKIKAKYILGKISLQKQNRKLEKSIINCMSKLYHPDFGNCCLDMCAATFYSIIVLLVTIATVMACLMVGGYYLNIILCILFSLWENTYFCLLSTNDGLLYLLGIIGFPLLMCTFGCCYACACPLVANDNRRVFPYGIV